MTEAVSEPASSPEKGNRQTRTSNQSATPYVVGANSGSGAASGQTGNSGASVRNARHPNATIVLSAW